MSANKRLSISLWILLSNKSTDPPCQFASIIDLQSSNDNHSWLEVPLHTLCNIVAATSLLRTILSSICISLSLYGIIVLLNNA